ncbi:MAG TPA: uroporphyrinogen-III C-methyltransferase [Aggregatilineales bacterium]|nr:uroporphyrinogen-III C-methyltransferase [Aggregatilineales bacterium]
MKQVQQDNPHPEKSSKPIGTVYLVGAGPGDPDLITVKGLRVLRQADVVVYDRLAPPELLQEVRPGTELVDVGKLPGKPRLDQQGINALLVERACSGKTVVRLKGGDPFVFGRGGEEALACFAAGVPFEVVPGVSSAFAVAAYAGVPLTQRHISSAFTVFTGYEDPAKADESIDYSALAKIGQAGTLVCLMGVTRLGEIADRLIAAGLDGQTPAMCIEWGTTDRQRVVEGCLAELPRVVIEANMQPPATLVVGEVTRLRDQGMRWFD